jgi:serine/threonine protein phosphatase 1
MIPTEHINWIKNLKLYHETADYFFVHAGLLDGITIEEHKIALEKEVHGKGSLSMTMIWIRDEFYASDYNWGKKVIFGHTVFKQPLVKKNMIGLDGMFHNVGNIHALILPEEEIISVNNSELSLDF